MSSNLLRILAAGLIMHSMPACARPAAAPARPGSEAWPFSVEGVSGSSTTLTGYPGLVGQMATELRLLPFTCPPTPGLTGRRLKIRFRVVSLSTQAQGPLLREELGAKMRVAEAGEAVLFEDLVEISLSSPLGRLSDTERSHVLARRIAERVCQMMN